MATTKVKEEAKQIVDKLPEDASWDELMRQIYVQQTIEKGLADSRAGRTRDVKEVRRRFGLSVE